ncbi:hypothetical protein [Kitasatospora sp. NPDC088134]|uniref:hypothetical protein n=1 Tax=Kitasatospora sp. NPDC088134 TaxID=3364071 RepID=UPI0038239A35
MDIFQADLTRPSADDVALLAEGSAFALRLQCFSDGKAGALALGILRDVCDLLCEPDGRRKPYVTAQAMCRVAIECLMDIGKGEAEGLQAARTAVKKSLAAVFEADGSPKAPTPVDGLFTTLDSLSAFPPKVTSGSALGKAVTKLLHARASATAGGRPPVSAFGAVQKVLDAVDALGTAVPEVLTAGHPLAVALRELHTIRSNEDFHRQAVLDRRLEALGTAYARQCAMEAEEDAYRVMLLCAVVRKETGREPGRAEKEAFRG